MKKYIKPAVDLIPAEIDDILTASRVSDNYYEGDTQLSRRGGLWLEKDEEE